MGNLVNGDPSCMLARTAEFPDLLERGLASRLAEAGPAPRRILWGGMGGSAAAGRVLSSWLAHAGGPAVEVVSGYGLPATGPGDLLLLASYSGNTEETLSLLEEGGRRELPLLALSAGGRLSERALARGLPCVSLPAGYPPRTAVPAMLGVLLALLRHWELLPGPLPELLPPLRGIAAACVADENPALELARALDGRAPVLLVLHPAYEGLAQRLRAQFEENAALAATVFALPELHHNRWVSWMEGPEAPARLLVLGAADAHPRVLERLRLSREGLAGRGSVFLELPAAGGDLLTRLLTTLLLGDFISVYGALQRGKDPGAIPSIDDLKAQLAKTL